MKEIVLQGQGQTMRAAVLEDGELVEVHEEEGMLARLVGNIYRGRVVNILPGMQAAFVDIGLEKNAFLYVGDAVPFQYDEDEKLPTSTELRVEHVLKPRQELLVQVAKEPVGSKGARITTNLTIPGRYAVLMPHTEYVGVSRKITDEQERLRLRKIARAACPPGKGIVVRTLAKGIDAQELEDDLQELVALWDQVEKEVLHISIPGLVHQDVNLVARAIRDWVDQEVEVITVNQPEVAEGMRQALKELGHPAANQVRLIYQEDIFSNYSIDDEIRHALQSKVWLKSGGYLVIQQTEALSVIDVNTGKYVGEKSLQDTIMHINQEAAAEIARQIRLRNLGGIIVIDFIDMTTEEAKEQLMNVLEKAVARDKVKCQIMGLTQLGLVEMTRKKVGQTLEVRYGRACPHCEGTGRIVKG
ncbi:RNAse G [Desulfitobacterium dichloroeliminans LMG P-21439]|uniref:RNAse G n=1 Tax=Desulfitobacterium dichloroeliminans (strain LMG P-21439 / DCA1) TaxID=871963 RepID=L0FB54_DESDL|nr:Rne/Rng family ribonuclease [Desulfitobacterium dichloroeliminans]AGA70457.1 RNAse G [Desulfitobacterium dichloroeliminans LMG P-21439]